MRPSSNTRRVPSDHLYSQFTSAGRKPPSVQVGLRLVLSPFTHSCCSLTSSTGGLQLSYTPVQTAVLINQAFTNTLGGFTPNTTSPDPNWGKCLQCAAFDRARLGLTPPPPRSGFCAQCFSQYCYDPENPPSANELPGRNYIYSNPDPGGVDKVEEFLSRNKDAIIGGAVAVAVLVGGGIAFM